MGNFSQLDSKLDQLAVQAASLDRQRGEHHVALFDQQLFHCQAKLLVPCVKEAQATFESIIREQESGRLTNLRAEYLTDTLLAQMAAIQRELSTQKIRKSEPKHSSYYRKPINQLYQELAQHNEWERRLREMVFEKQRSLNHCPAFQQPQMQKELLATEQRLKRCSEAKLKIEKQITFREKHQ
ncbi:primosomal replication protein [Vibrio maerlii]|uniref:primosomal replication protein n=1 Tax=Vibrio maerlii TaxID=2231648 RepID=UPI000E3EA6AE|nr:primosomal replication protein [Vibrio maerlii]